MYKAIRYIGSKQKMLPFLKEHLLQHLDKPHASFFDGFVGTGIVSQFVAENYKNVAISGGDISLYSAVLFNILNIGLIFPNQDRLIILLEDCINLVGDTEPQIIFNEFSQHGKPSSFNESRNFFHAQSGKTIDNFRNYLNNNLQESTITLEEASILLYFILAYSCKVANTTSVFGAYLKGEAKHVSFNIEFCQNILNNIALIGSNVHIPARFYHASIVDSLKVIPHQSVIYLDPPYSTRRYESNYHILNYIVDLDFNPSVLKNGSKTGQAISLESNPFGKKAQTEQIFKEMIDLGVSKCDLLGISYNSDGVITQQWMESYCQKQGYALETKTQEYKRFKSKVEVTNTTTLQEILWLIKK